MRQQQPIWPNFRFTDHVTLQINYAQACDIARLDMILPFQTCFSFRMLPVHNISSFVVGPGLSCTFRRQAMSVVDSSAALMSRRFTVVYAEYFTDF